MLLWWQLVLFARLWPGAAAESACGHDGTDVMSFDAATGLALTPGAPLSQRVTIQKFGINSPEGPRSIDIASEYCQDGRCTVIVEGTNLDEVLTEDPSLTLQQAKAIVDMGIMPHHRVFCFFGLELPCAPVPLALSDTQIMCSSPTLPEKYGISPFGIFVLKPDLSGPGTLYVADGLEINFYDTRAPPVIVRLVPPFSDHLVVPDEVRVIGYNFGPSTLGVACQWDGQEAREGKYDADVQSPGDDESEVLCQGPLYQDPELYPEHYKQPGSVAYLRVSTTGRGVASFGEGDAEPALFSRELFGAPPRAPLGAPLVYFDANRKPQLYAHALLAEPPSEVYGDVSGGARLVLRGENFAPLGPGIQCAFHTRLHSVREGNCSQWCRASACGCQTVVYNVSLTRATFHSPTIISCLSPPYDHIGETTLFVNTSYNSTLFAGPDGGGSVQVAQTVPFTYYDRNTPPTVNVLHPSYSPTAGQQLQIEGDWQLDLDHGHWNGYKGAELHGGVIVQGTNFAPTQFLWCAFGMPAEHGSTRGPWRSTRAVYINATAMRCEVPRGHHGDFPVAATTDDVTYSRNTSILTYYDPTNGAIIMPGQKLPVPSGASGYVFYDIETSQAAPVEFPYMHSVFGHNFYPSSLVTPHALLCRYGEAPVAQQPHLVRPNMTSPLEAFENIVDAIFISAHEVRCITPRREPGTTVKLYVSTGGMHNFSDNYATVVYWNEAPITQRLTRVSSISPAFGPIHGGTVVTAIGTNFAPTGPYELKCTLAPSSPLLPRPWSYVYHFVPAHFVDFGTVLCNLSAALYDAVGDATLGVTNLATTERQNSRFQTGPSFTFYDPTRGATVVDEGINGEQPGFIGHAYGVSNPREEYGETPGTAVVTGENFAPSVALVCEFFAARAFGGPADAPAASAVPLHTTTASFASATRVACALPPAPIGSMHSVHVRVATDVPPGTSAATVVHYDPRAPATLHDVTAESTGAAYADVSLDGGRLSLTVHGSNFAPTNLLSGDAEDGRLDNLRCGLWPLPPSAVEAARANEEAGEPPGLEPPSAIPFRANAKHGETPATYLAADTVRCEFRTAALSCRPAGTCGDAQLRVAHAGGKDAWSNSSLRFSLYDSTKRSPLHSVVPQYADRNAPVLLEVRGANFAPKNGDEARCRFRSVAGDAFSNATVVSSELLRCEAPSRPLREGSPSAPLGAPDEIVRLAVAHSAATAAAVEVGGDVAEHGWTDAPLPVRCVDSTLAPVVSSFVPRYGPVYEATHVIVSGFNLGGIEPEMLRCRFGRAPSTQGRWMYPTLSYQKVNESVECVAPPARYQLANSLLKGEQVSNRQGIGGALVRLSIDGGASYSEARPYIDGSLAAGNATFAYYDPTLPPVLLSLATPKLDGLPTGVTLPASDINGGVLAVLKGLNLAPTSSLSCAFGDAVVPASFIDVGEVRCLSPSQLDAAVDADVTTNVTVDVRLALHAPDADNAYAPANGPWSEAALALVYFAIASPPSIATITPALGPLNGGVEVLACGANVAPSVGLRCRFAPYPTCEDADCSNLAGAPTVTATFVSDACVRCIAPDVAALNLTEAHDVYVSVANEAGAPHSMPGLPFTYHDTSLPSPVTRIAPDYADWQSGGTITVRGANFAPTSGAGPRCVWGNEVVSSPATFINVALLHCAAPRCADESCLGTHLLRASFGGFSSASADSGVHFTFYKSAEAPQLLSVMPAALPGRGALIDVSEASGADKLLPLTLHASNLAPTLGALRCSFNDGIAWDVHVTATFVDAHLAYCTPPANDGLGTRFLSITHDSGGRWSSNYQLTLYDGSSPPLVESFAPILAATPLHRGASPPAISPGTDAYEYAVGARRDTDLQISGSNFAPIASLACVFTDGSATFFAAAHGSASSAVSAITSGSITTPATFVSDKRVVCAAPPAATGASPTVGVTLGIGSGGVGVAGGYNLVYYGPMELPTVLELNPPFGDLLAVGSSAHVMRGTNFAPTGMLRCRYGFNADASYDVDASFVSVSSIACARPSFDIPLDVPVLASHDGANFSTTAARFTYYDAAQPPTLSSFSPNFGPHPGSGVVLHVSGTNFAPTPTLACSVGGVVSAATFDSSFLVRCALPPMGGSYADGSADVAVGVTTDGAVYTELNGAYFTYYDPRLPPTISFVTPNFGSVSGGEIVSIFGSNFIPAATGRLLCTWAGSGAPPSAATFDSHALLRCTAPTVAMPGDVTVGVTTNSDLQDRSLPSDDGSDRYTYRDPRFAPETFEVLPPVCDVAPGAPACTLTVLGHGFVPSRELCCSFRRVQRAPGESGTLLVSPATFESASSVRCVTQYTGSDSGDYYVAVHVDNGSLTTLEAFTGAAAAADTWQSATAAAAAHPAKLSAAVASRAAAWLVVYNAAAAPGLTSASPGYADPDGGTLITLAGSNIAPTRRHACVFMGAASGSFAVVVAHVFGYAAVSCEAPPAIALDATASLGAFTVSLSLDGDVSGAGLPLAYATATVSLTAPLAGPTFGGTHVLLRGVGLGSITRCLFGGWHAPNVTGLQPEVQAASATDNEVRCIAPAHVAGAVSIGLSAGGVHWREAALFTYYEQPVVIGLVPTAGRADSDVHGRGGETLVRVQGHGFLNWVPPDASKGPALVLCCFGDAHAEATARTNPFSPATGSAVTTATGVTSTQLKCYTPPLPPGHRLLHVALNGQNFVAAPTVERANFTFFPMPMLLGISPAGGPVTGGTAVALFARGLLPHELMSRGLVDLRCRFGDAYHADYQHVVRALPGATDEAAVCISPSTLVANYTHGLLHLVEVRVALNGGGDATLHDVDFVPRVPPASFQYYRNELLSTWPTGGPTEGGTLVTLQGSGFKTFVHPDAKASGYLASVWCKFGEAVVSADASSVTDSTAVCVLPANSTTGRALVQISLNGVDFHGRLDGGELRLTYYSPPVLWRLEPPGGPLLGGTVVSIHGANLTAFGFQRVMDGPPRMVVDDEKGCANTPCANRLRTFGLDAVGGGGFVVDGVGRPQLTFVRGLTYTFVHNTTYNSANRSLDSPLALSPSRVAGKVTLDNLVTTGPIGSHPVSGLTADDSTLIFTPDSSLPSVLYYQSTTLSWGNPSDPSTNRIVLRQPHGEVSRAPSPCTSTGELTQVLLGSPHPPTYPHHTPSH